LYNLLIATQVIDLIENDVKALNKCIQWQIQNATKGLRFVKLDKASLHLLYFIDASFIYNKDLSSQIGYVIILANNVNRVNIFH
jgi:hypothetical protein